MLQPPLLRMADPRGGEWLAGRQSAKGGAFKGKIMSSLRTTSLFDTIAAAFAQGLTFGFSYHGGKSAPARRH